MRGKKPTTKKTVAKSKKTITPMKNAEPNVVVEAPTVKLAPQLRVELFTQLKSLPYETVSPFIQVFQLESVNEEQLKFTIDKLSAMLDGIAEKIAFSAYINILQESLKVFDK